MATYCDQWADVLRRRQGATVDAISVPVGVIDWLEQVRDAASNADSDHYWLDLHALLNEEATDA